MKYGSHQFVACQLFPLCLANSISGGESSYGSRVLGVLA